MKDLNERILELINEEDDGPSFGGDDSSSDSETSSSEDTSSNDSSDNGGSSSDDSPSFGGDDSSSDDSGNDSSNEDSSEDNNDEDKDDSSDNSDDKDKDDEEDEEEEFKAKDFKDFLSQTNSKIKITKISSEPSTIFGNNDTKNHNKYKITITNEEGFIWFYFWDSLYNTENNKKPSQDDVLACFGMDVGSVMDGISKEEFIEISGYDKTEDSTAQKAYEGCQKMLERAKKLFKDNQIKELLRLSQEY